MNRYVILLVVGLAIGLIFLALWRGNHGRSGRDQTGQIELRSVPSTKPSTSPVVIESVEVTNVSVLSEQELREIAATNPAIRETEWFKATTRESK
jgi:hypothetical protein